MSSLPECKMCGKYQHHGEVVCMDCLPKIIRIERDTVLDILRPEVLTFALLMERKLRKHDKDRGDSYKTTDVDYLLMRLREEVKELHNAIEDDPWDGKGVSLGESVDVGNISMMIGYHDYQFPMDVFIEELVEELRQAYHKKHNTIFDDGRWKINREDGGMGEKDYYIFLNDVFVASTDSEDMARRIVRTMKMNEAVGL